MTPDRWKLVEELFNEAVELASSDRPAFLDRNCTGDAELRAELESLLASDSMASSGDLIAGHVRSAVTSLAEERTAHPTKAGPYRLLKELGRGGMGSVYLAVRDEEFEKRVAVKLVRHGMDTQFILARFRRERQILARLEHPNIARLLDGGSTTDGLPYIAMEYVDGVWITDYCRDKKLSVREILNLFLQVCSAVDYAHRNFIVHRDLKPGNILIDASGTPKLLDFGISKLMMADTGSPMEDTQTMTAHLMTPDYACPEQVTGDHITIVSDVYSLGTILYELLTGQRAQRVHRFTPQDLVRVVCEQLPPRPSAAVEGNKQLAKSLEGDLDTIILRAIQKEPARRYQAVADFAADIRRHLDDLPITARPDTIRYRAVKFARRNRAYVVASVLVLVSLTAGVVVSQHQAQEARRQAENVRRLANAYVVDVHDAINNLPGTAKARERMLKVSIQYLDGLAKESRSDPSLQRDLAAAYMRMASVQGDVLVTNLGNNAEAMQIYGKALNLFDSYLSAVPKDEKTQIDRINVLRRIGDIQYYGGDFKGAIANYKRAMRFAQEYADRNPKDLKTTLAFGDLYQATARIQRNKGDDRGSLESAQQALALYRSVLDADRSNIESARSLASVLATTGMAKARLGNLNGAHADYRESVEMLEKLVGATPEQTHLKRELVLAYGHLGDVLGFPNTQNLGRTADSHKQFQKAVNLSKEIYDADPDDLRAAGDYALALMRLASVSPDAEQLDVYTRSVEILDKITIKSPTNLFNLTNVAYTRGQMGEIELRRNNRTGALNNLRIAANVSRKILAIEPNYYSAVRNLVLTLRTTATEYAKLGQRELAIAAAEECIAAVEKFEQGSAANRAIMMARAHSMARGAYAALAASSAKRPGDSDKAKAEHQKCVEAWGQARQLPDMTDQTRKEMERDLAWKPV